MVTKQQHEFRKRDLLATGGLWLISLILPDPHLPYRKELLKKRDFFYVGVLILLPLIWPGSLFLLGLAGIYAMVALGLSLFLGYAGQISLGHAAFFGIGAYTFAILTTRSGVAPVGALGAAVVAAAACAYLVGKPILKLKGYFLALATLGFGEIFLVIVRETRDLTGGVSGIFGVPWFTVAGFTFDTYLKQYCLIWGILVGLVLFAKNLVRSKMGRAMLAVAVSEDAAASVGINVVRVKLGVFVISAAFAGLAGSLFAGVMSTASPDAFGLGLSVLIVMMVIMGGMGTLYGPIFAAIFLTWLTNALGAYQEYSLPIFGVIIILLLIFFPDGVGTRLNARLIYLISYWGRKRRREKVDI
jgi:branched-chain amino acid transport system permease protein